MAYKKKAILEKEFVDMILSKGGIELWSCMAEDTSNYYEMKLKNGEIRYWKDFSIDSLKRLGIYEEREE